MYCNNLETFPSLSRFAGPSLSLQGEGNGAWLCVKRKALAQWERVNGKKIFC